MSEHVPEPEVSRETAIEHSELKSIRGSAEAIDLTPGDNFIAPTMAVTAYDSESSQ